MQLYAEEKCYYNLFSKETDKTFAGLFDLNVSINEPDEGIAIDMTSPRYQPRKMTDVKDKALSTRKTSEFVEELGSILQHGTDTTENSVCMFSMQSIIDFKPTTDINKDTVIVSKPELTSPDESVLEDISLCKRESLEDSYASPGRERMFYKTSLKKKVKNSKLFWSGKTLNYPFIFDKVTKVVEEDNSSSYYYVKDMSKKLISHSRKC